MEPADAPPTPLVAANLLLAPGMAQPALHPGRALRRAAVPQVRAGTKRATGYTQSEGQVNGRKKLTNTTIRLLFAGVLAVMGVLATLTLALVGMLKGLSTETVLALSGPFASVTFASVTFFLGHANGVEAVKKNGG